MKMRSLRPILDEAFEVFGDKSQYVVAAPQYRAAANTAMGWKNANLSSEMTRLLRRAGVSGCPRLFHYGMLAKQTQTGPESGARGLRKRSYNDQGLVERVQAPTGTITWTIYDGLRREIGTWIGTNDSTANGFKWSPSNNTGSSNMVQVTSMTYDAGSVGDGNVTQVIAMPGIGTNRVMQSAFDWRNRRVTTKSGVEAIESESTNRSVSYFKARPGMTDVAMSYKERHPPPRPFNPNTMGLDDWSPTTRSGTFLRAVGTRHPRSANRSFSIANRSRTMPKAIRSWSPPSSDFTMPIAQRLEN